LISLFLHFYIAFEEFQLIMKDLSEHLYSERHYWDARFKTEDIYEWLTDLNSFEHLLLPEIELNDK
jgi:hypothetical protein